MPEGQPLPQEPEEESLDDATPGEPPVSTTSASVPNPDKKEASEPKKTATEPAKPAGNTKRVKGLGKLRGSANVYLWIYILVVIVALLIVGAAYLMSKQPPAKKVTTKSLTSEQLSQLQGPTTIVGDANQTLDIQSNAVFEGAILARKNLDVAGSLKLGGAFSLPSITISGSGSVGKFQVNDSLGVAGDTTLQGTVTLQKGLSVQGGASFGSISAGTLSVTNLNFSGDIVISKHIVGSGGVPGRSNGTALGGGGTVGINGSDTAGTVSINTGSSPPAGCFVTLNFASKYATTPHVVISPSNSSAGGLDYYTNRSSSGFSICTANSPAPSATYFFDYIVIQ